MRWFYWLRQFTFCAATATAVDFNCPACCSQIFPLICCYSHNRSWLAHRAPPPVLLCSCDFQISSMIGLMKWWHSHRHKNTVTPNFARFFFSTATRLQMSFLFIELCWLFLFSCAFSLFSTWKTICSHRAIWQKSTYFYNLLKENDGMMAEQLNS